MAAADPGSLSLQQETAANIEPSRLVNQWVDIEGLGLGRVVSFQKRSAMSPLADSTHVVEFEQHDPRMQTLVLRRRKLMSWNKGRRFRLSVAPAAHDSSSASLATAASAASEAASEPPLPPPLPLPPPPRKTAAFLSHFKGQAGTEARFVHDKLQTMMGDGTEIFLDSDDLQDLRLLLDHVKASNVLVLLQTKGVLERPWVILELHTAITHNVPIVALNIHNAWPYDYGVALDFLTNFDKDIEVANPGAAQLLIEHGVDPVDVAWRLSTVLPSIISTDFHPNSSTNSIK